jgi:hypothetical protein
MAAPVRDALTQLLLLMKHQLAAARLHGALPLLSTAELASKSRQLLLMLVLLVLLRYSCTMRWLYQTTHQSSLMQKKSVKVQLRSMPTNPAKPWGSTCSSSRSSDRQVAHPDCRSVVDVRCRWQSSPAVARHSAAPAAAPH